MNADRDADMLVEFEMCCDMDGQGGPVLPWLENILDELYAEWMGECLEWPHAA